MERPYKVATSIVPTTHWNKDDLGSSLSYQASVIEERFLETQLSETFPMIHMFSEDHGEIRCDMYILEERATKEVRSRISEYVSLARYLEGFVAAIVTMEVHLVDVVNEKGVSIHRESLLLSLYDRPHGLISMRSIGFHREEDPGEPIVDHPLQIHTPDELMGRFDIKLKADG